MASGYFLKIDYFLAGTKNKISSMKLKKVCSSFGKILQHISLEKVFLIQGVAFIHIFLFQATAF